MTSSKHQGINIDDIDDEKKVERILDALLEHKDKIDSVIISCGSPTENMKQKIVDVCKALLENNSKINVTLQVEAANFSTLFAGETRPPGLILEDLSQKKSLSKYGPSAKSQTTSKSSLVEEQAGQRMGDGRSGHGRR